MTKKENTALALGLLLIVLAPCLFLLRTVSSSSKITAEYERNLDSTIAKEINGTIIHLKDKGRGTYSLKIKTADETFEIKSLSIAYTLKKYAIEVGDSVSKEPNSAVLNFYKLEKGTYEPTCEYDMNRR